MHFFVYIGMLSSTVNLPHHVLCLFVFLTMLIWLTTIVFQHLSNSDKRGWLTRWRLWSFTNPMWHNDNLCQNSSVILPLCFISSSNVHSQLVSSSQGGSFYCFWLFKSRADCSTVGLYCVTITWQQICKGSLYIVVAGVLLHETAERRHLGR